MGILGNIYNKLISPFKSNAFNSLASISQLICALTSFYGSLCGPFFLNTTTFRKWVIYNTGYFLIQSFQRNIYLENHLLSGSENSRKFWQASRLIPFLTFLLPLISVFLLNLRFSFVDIVMIAGFLLALFQDRFRYLFLSLRPKVAISGDSTWLTTSLLLTIFGLIFTRKHLEDIFLLQIVIGPLLGLIPLLAKSAALGYFDQKKESLGKENTSYLNYLRIQFYIGSLVSLAVSITIVKYLSVIDLKTFKIIQTLLSPYQSLGAILYVAVYSNRQRSTSEFSYKNVMRVSKKLLIAPILVVATFHLVFFLIKVHFSKSYWFIPNIDDLGIALVGPILMSSFIPIGAYLRRNLLGKEILAGGLAGSITYLSLLYLFNYSKTIFGIFFSTSTAAVVSIILNVLFARRDSLQMKAREDT